MLNPPRSPRPPELPEDAEVEEADSPRKETSEDDGELPGGLAGAPVGA